MAFLTQNMNQFAGLAMLGAVDLVPSPKVISAQILPTSAVVYIQQTSVVKLVAGVSGAILVDIQTGPTDAAAWGVIPYNPQKNKYVKGDIIEVVIRGVVYMRSSAAITRGARVSVTAATISSDPLVTTDATSGHFTIGVALDQAAAADELIRIDIDPLTNP